MNLFVANFNSGTIGEYTTSGVVVDAALISGLHSPADVAVSGSNLFVYNDFYDSTNSSYGPGTIGEYTISGTVVNASLITGLPTDGGRLSVFGSDLFVDNDYNYDVSEYTTSGNLVNPSLISGLDDPSGIVVTPEPCTITLIAVAGLGLLLRRSGKGQSSCVPRLTL